MSLLGRLSLFEDDKENSSIHFSFFAVLVMIFDTFVHTRSNDFYLRSGSCSTVMKFVF